MSLEHMTRTIFWIFCRTKSSDVVFELGLFQLHPVSEFSIVWVHFGPSEAGRFLKVQDGCSHRCSYCIVPIARGPSRSMDVTEGVTNVRDLVGAGYSEIALTGIHLGAYGRDLSPKSGLENLVEKY